MSLDERNPHVPPARIEHYGKRCPSEVAAAHLNAVTGGAPPPILFDTLPVGVEPWYVDFFLLDAVETREHAAS